MPYTQRVLDVLDGLSADPDLVESLLTSRSNAEAAVSYSLLRAVVPERELVMLANLREIIAELPDSPFDTCLPLEILASSESYEWTGRSYRRLFESDHGVFGLEFAGSGNLCEGISVHTAAGRFSLDGSIESIIDHDVLHVLMRHRALLDAIIEGLHALGHPLHPRIYVTADDFPAEYAATVAGEVLGDLF